LFTSASGGKGAVNCCGAVTSRIAWMLIDAVCMFDFQTQQHGLGMG